MILFYMHFGKLVMLNLLNLYDNLASIKNCKIRQHHPLDAPWSLDFLLKQLALLTSTKFQFFSLIVKRFLE